jgi:hypothetical protein
MIPKGLKQKEVNQYSASKVAGCMFAKHPQVMAWMFLFNDTRGRLIMSRVRVEFGVKSLACQTKKNISQKLQCPL